MKPLPLDEFLYYFHFSFCPVYLWQLTINNAALSQSDRQIIECKKRSLFRTPLHINLKSSRQFDLSIKTFLWSLRRRNRLVDIAWIRLHYEEVVLRM